MTVNNANSWQRFLDRVGLQGIVKNIYLLLLIALFCVLNISMGHYAENTLRDLNTKTEKLKQLRWKYVNEKSQYMFLTKESELAKHAVSQGLNVLTQPPSKLEIKNPSVVSHE